MRTRNKGYYRVLHWPIWIWVFFLAPGPLVFSLFAHGFSVANGAWLALVLLGTGIAGVYGQLPGVEPAPYILRFDEDRPNPLYRKVCYTFAWNAALNFALLNLTGLIIAVITGVWTMKQLYQYVYFPLAILILLLGAFGKLPRVGKVDKKRRHRAPLFLRHRVGGNHLADRTDGPLEDSPPHTHRQPGQARHLCGDAVCNGRGRIQRRPSAHTANPARRIDGGLNLNALRIKMAGGMRNPRAIFIVLRNVILLACNWLVA